MPTEATVAHGPPLGPSHGLQAPPAGQWMQAPPAGQWMQAPPAGQWMQAPPAGQWMQAPPAGQRVSQYANPLPLYRQAQICNRQGVNLDRSTLCRLGRPCWVDRAAFAWRPVFDALIADRKRSSKLLMPSRPIALQSSAGSQMRPARRFSIRARDKQGPDGSGHLPAMIDLGAS